MLLGAVLAVSGALAPLPADAETPVPVRVLLVGDSVTQGSAGDWTWRYRLWQMLGSSDVVFDLVGPRDDLADNVAGTLGGSWDYADPAFDRDHAARWGMALVDPDVSMSDLVSIYRPDVVVEARGINDLTFYRRSAEQLAADLTGEIAEARSVDPSVGFVVDQLPQIWYDGSTDGAVTTYNTGLRALAAELSVAGSPVVVADTGAGFIREVDTWDDAHLAATGEVKYAAAVADALAEIGIGPGAPDPLPEVVNGHWRPATDVRAEAGDGQATLSWTLPPGCARTYVWGRDATEGGAWTRLDFPVTGTTWTGSWLTNGHTYEYRLQSVKGAVVADAFSDVVSVTPQAAPDPVPPPGVVTAADVEPGTRQLLVSWDEVDTATSYDVAWVGAPGDGGSTTVPAPPITLTDLVGGQPYTVTITARNDGGLGSPVSVTGTPEVEEVPASDPPLVTPGVVPSGVVVTPGVPVGPEVAGPARLRVKVLGPRRVRLTWRGRPAATAYALAIRRNGRWRPAGTTTATSFVVRDLRRGTVGFRVRSWHERVAGGWSDVVRLRLRP